MTKFLKIYEALPFAADSCGHVLLNVDMIDNTALLDIDATKSTIAFYSFARTTPYADVNKPWSYIIETASVVGNPYPWDGDFLKLIQDQIRMVKSKSYTKVITPLLPGWGEELNNFNPAGVPPAISEKNYWPLAKWPYPNKWAEINAIIKEPA